MSLGRSTRASIRCSLRPLQRKETSLWIDRRAQVILASLSLQFKVDSSIPHIMVNASLVLLISLILLLGATIHACCSNGRHIVALEHNADIFKEVLMPMQDPKPLPARSTHVLGLQSPTSLSRRDKECLLPLCKRKLYFV